MRIKKRWENEELIEINRAPSHTDFLAKRKVKSLNGKWKFLFLEAPEYAPTNFNLCDFDDSQWNEINVPSNWQFEGYDKMHYTDVLYLFPINPPFVPSNNPTGIYRTEFTLSENELDKDLILTFGGVNSAFDIWVNGVEAGYGKCSRLSSEYDISSFVKVGKNNITVRVYKWSDGTYLEDQDQWWLSGIYRDVNLVFKPKSSIENVIIKTSFPKDSLDGILDIDLTLKNINDNYSVKYSLCEKDSDCIIHKNTLLVGKETHYKINQVIESVAKWSAETPNLYTITFQLENNGKSVDSISVDFGFREITIEDNIFKINGEAVLLNGVNYHDFSPKSGQYVDYDTVVEDLILMKKSNINTIRCAHYPKQDWFYYLCDYYGFYVIDEADIELHGFEWIEKYDWLDNEKSWERAFSDRIIRMVEKHQNHPSIIMWSLGNESSIGKNFVTAVKELKQIDLSRPVHYEGDFEADISDIYSTMYTSIDGLKNIANGHQAHNKPHFHCEYVHAMGNGPGNLALYQKLYRENSRLMGGCIWEWYDHGIKTLDDNKKTYYKYGGEYGDTPNNSNFCMDGLLMPNRKPSPALNEVKQVFAPIEIEELDLDFLRFEVKNYNSFLSLSEYYIKWEIKKGLSVLDQGIRLLTEENPRESELIDISSECIFHSFDAPVYINFSIQIANNTLYCESAYEVAHYQFELPVLIDSKYEAKRCFDEITVCENNHTLTLKNDNFSLEFDKVKGLLKNYILDGNSLIEKGPRICIDRAPIDNDMYKINDWYNKYFINKIDEQLESFTLIKDMFEVIVKIETHVSCFNQAWGFKCLYEYCVYSDGTIDLNLKASSFKWSNVIPKMLPRLGIMLINSKTFDRVKWFGLGPDECYCDSKSSAMYGIYEKSISDLHTRYEKPQENGHREGVKWLNIFNENSVLSIKSKEKIGFNIQNYSIDQLRSAKHDSQLVEDPINYIYLDAIHSGLGSNSCGEEQMFENKATVSDFSLNLTFSNAKNIEINK